MVDTPPPSVLDLDSKIEAKNVNLFYGTYQALHDISLKFASNKVTALIGPSGCGKSTFLRCLNRMNDEIESCRIEGDFFIDGVDIYSNSVRPEVLRKEVGMVFQKPNPFPGTVEDNILFGPRLHGIPKREEASLVESCLRKAALWESVKDKLKKSALQLSGGEQQRLCIARTLAVSPKIILMDEPCSALDPISTNKIEELIRELAKDITIVIVTHNMQQAQRISQYTAFFNKGRIVEYDETYTIFFKPNRQETEDYIRGRFG